jgi:hypothetical protein
MMIRTAFVERTARSGTKIKEKANAKEQDKYLKK